MFKRINMWLRRKLGVAALNNELLLTKAELKKTKDKLREVTSQNETIIRDNNELRRKILHSTSQYNALMELVDLGIDVEAVPPRHGGPKSWAVVCLAGKVHYMKFYVLGDDHMQSIYDFLKPFDQSNCITDVPDFMRRYMI